MSNNQLPAGVQDKIFQEGQDLLAFEPDNKNSYIKGATAYATKLHECRELLIEFVQAYKDGALKWRAFEIHEKAKTFLNGE